MDKIPTSTQTSSSTQNLMTFRLAQQIYALPVEPIVQIIPMLTITPVPQVADVVEGVINIHGQSVPVVDMRRHIGLLEARPQLHTPIVLTRIGGSTVGLIVDEVLDVFGLSTDGIILPSDVFPKGMAEAPVLRGVVCFPDSTVLLLDPDHLFSPRQQEALAQAVQLLPELMLDEAAPEAVGAEVAE